MTLALSLPAIHAATYSRLRGLSTVTVLLAKRLDVPTEPAIFDGTAGDSDSSSPVPGGQPYPYLILGDKSMEQPNDTFSSRLWNATFNVDMYTREKSFETVYLLADLINDSLHRAKLSASGLSLCTLYLDQFQSLVDPDNEVRYGVLRYRVFTQAA